MLLLKTIGEALIVVFILLYIAAYLLMWFGNNLIWRKNGDKNILLMLSTCTFQTTLQENKIIIKNTANLIEKKKLFIFTYYRIASNIDVPPFTRSHKFITKLFKALNPGGNKIREINIFGEQVKNM